MLIQECRPDIGTHTPLHAEWVSGHAAVQSGTPVRAAFGSESERAVNGGLTLDERRHHADGHLSVTRPDTSNI